MSEQRQSNTEDEPRFIIVKEFSEEQNPDGSYDIIGEHKEYVDP